MNTPAITRHHEVIEAPTVTASPAVTVADAWAQLQFSSMLQSSLHSSQLPSWNPNGTHDDDEEENA